MNVRQKLNLDYRGLCENGPINIVVFGDSVTHGALNGTVNYETVYWNVLKKKLNAVRDYMPINMINAGIGGITATLSLDRIERDVTSHHPDLVIVCFGLNDVNTEKEDYISSMRTIFTKCLDCGADVIFMTPNMLNTYVHKETREDCVKFAHETYVKQLDGRMDDYMQSAMALAKEMGVTVCDCYSRWRKLYDSGVDTTELLINKINHPTPQMHQLFADMLFDTIMGTEEFEANTYADTMYKEDK